MLTSDVALHQIARVHAAELRREALTERLLRQARHAMRAEDCCRACCEDDACRPCEGRGCLAGCCAEEPCDDAGDPTRAPWRPVAGLGAGLRAGRRGSGPRVPRFA